MPARDSADPREKTAPDQTVEERRDASGRVTAKRGREKRKDGEDKEWEARCG